MADAPNAEQEKMRHSLRETASKVAEVRSARAGDIVLRLSGKGGGTYRLPAGGKEVEVSEITAAVSAQPLIEVIGDAEAIQEILDGRVDAREGFLAGGIRVRGDLRHLSDLALEIGLLKHPL